MGRPFQKMAPYHLSHTGGKSIEKRPSCMRFHVKTRHWRKIAVREGPEEPLYDAMHQKKETSDWRTGRGGLCVSDKSVLFSPSILQYRD